MDLAVKTVASTAEIWVMVIVLSILTGILVSAAAMADAWQVRANRRARRLAALGFREVGGADPDAAPVAAVVAGDMTHAGAAGAAGGAGAGREMVPAPRPGGVAADAPTRPDLPAVPGGQALPGQRGGESDRAERAGAPDDDPGQRQP